MRSRVPKLKLLIYIYCILYFLVSAWTITSDVKEKEPWWEIAGGVVLLPLGGIGILLFLFGVNHPAIKSTWKVISILVVAGQILVNLVSRYLTLSGKTNLDSEKISQWAILGADLAAVLFFAPMFALNLLFAFS